MPNLLTLSLVLTLVVAAAAWRWRSRAYALFRLISLALFSLLSAGLFESYTASALLVALHLALHATVFVHSLSRIRPNMRSLLYRSTIGIPSAFFASALVLALPWIVAASIGYPLAGVWVPFVLSAVGVYQSLSQRREDVHIHLNDGVMHKLQRHRSRGQRTSRPLRIVQITDPHLGPFMSTERLEAICQRAVNAEPDIIALTGDFLTMESQTDPNVLVRALAPLRSASGRVFACMGNHDYEAPELVTSALRTHGIHLLQDESADLETPAGSVQIVGSKFHFRERAKQLAALTKACPRKPDHFRLVLLHDPGAFKYLPEGEADLVLSGHTHGGQVGLQSLGLDWTFVRLVKGHPDHGLWARGTDRLYVHRGTGHYGFPIRLGVSSEESVLHIHQNA